jgi:hypothetical protein
MELALHALQLSFIVHDFVHRDNCADILGTGGKLECHFSFLK